MRSLSYRATHWGEGGDFDEVDVLVPQVHNLCPDCRRRQQRPLVLLGTLDAVVYSTSKGFEGRAPYEHEFQAKRPFLAYTPGAAGLFVVTAGKPHYRITPRGIVG